MLLVVLFAYTLSYGQIRQRGIIEFNSVAELKNTPLQPQDSDFAVVVSPDGATVQLFNYETGIVADEENNFALTNFSGTWVGLKTPTQVGYSVFPIWAEESADLGASANEGAYGNGNDTPQNMGVVIPVDCEIFAVTLSLEGGTGTVMTTVNGVDVGAQVSTIGTLGSTILTSPISVEQDDYINFQTVASSGADTNGGLVTVWCRIPLLGVKGIKGDKGDDGLNGIPNQILRTDLGTVANINVTGTLFTYDTALDVNTVGVNADVNLNNIVLEPGTYAVKMKPNYSTVASNLQRAAIGARFFLNGTQYGDDHYNMSYNRHASGHEVSGDYYEDVFTVTTTTTFTASSIQQGAGGGTVLEGGRLIIIKYN